MHAEFRPQQLCKPPYSCFCLTDILTTARLYIQTILDEKLFSSYTESLISRYDISYLNPYLPPFRLILEIPNFRFSYSPPQHPKSGITKYPLPPSTTTARPKATPTTSIPPFSISNCFYPTRPGQPYSDSKRDSAA
jgi:hypothetical protein